MEPGTVLRIANTDETRWLLQAELKAIKEGFEYQEVWTPEHIRKGYVNSDGLPHGVGITNYGGRKEYREDKSQIIKLRNLNVVVAQPHKGIVKHELGDHPTKIDSNGYYWGEWDGRAHGYGTRYSSWGTLTGQWEAGLGHGYAILFDQDLGSIYRGQFL